MADPAVLAQLQQLVSQLNALQQIVGNLQASKKLLPQELLPWKLKTPPSLLPTQPSGLKSRTSQEALRLAALPEVVQEPHP
jgi:hypothetical protein